MDCTQRITWVFSGSSCQRLIGDYRRGVAGCIPASCLADIDSKIWNLLEAGEQDRAVDLHNKKVVLEIITLGMSPIIARKWILQRRGILTGAFVRNQEHLSLDEHDTAELERGMKLPEPYFVESELSS